MIDLKEWQRWFETKGYNSKLWESDSKDVSDELAIFVGGNVSVHITNYGRVCVNGSFHTESKTDLWKLINTLGVIQ